MLASPASTRELLDACRILFGTDVSVSDAFLLYLQPVGIKAAYRKRAFETHPDRLKAIGRYHGDPGAQFRQIREAYEILLAFHSSKHRVQPRTRPCRETRKGPPPRSHRTRADRPKARRTADHYYTGTLPRRTLLLGQFLYYAGHISWRTLIEAIAWQRQQRPKIGTIAVRWGFLTSSDVLRVLAERTLHERFGECARRIGYITAFEHLALVGKQRMLQRLFGDYFIEHGILSRRIVADMVSRQKRHNRQRRPQARPG
jgi:hypothetical protein